MSSHADSNANDSLLVSDIAHLSPEIALTQEQLTNEIQIFDADNEQSNEISKLIEQFDPLNDSIGVNRTNSPTYVNNSHKNNESAHETTNRLQAKPSNSIDPLTPSIYPHVQLSESNLIDFN